MNSPRLALQTPLILCLCHDHVKRNWHSQIGELLQLQDVYQKPLLAAFMAAFLNSWSRWHVDVHRHLGSAEEFHRASHSYCNQIYVWSNLRINVTISWVIRGAPFVCQTWSLKELHFSLFGRFWLFPHNSLIISHAQWWMYYDKLGAWVRISKGLKLRYLKGTGIANLLKGTE